MRCTFSLKDTQAECERDGGKNGKLQMVNCTWQAKEKNNADYTNSRKKINFKSKTPKRQTRSSHNDKGVNLSSGYSNCKYIYTLYGST